MWDIQRQHLNGKSLSEASRFVGSIRLSVSDLLIKTFFYDNIKISFTRETNGHLIRQPSLPCSSANKNRLVLELGQEKGTNLFS